MARSWTRLHEHLGHRPGPVTYDMIVAAVESKLSESDDLDWKGALPSFARTPGVWNEFAKDVASMANTRGGLLVYGVSDTIELVGIDWATVDDKQLLSVVRNGVQPFISGVDFIPLRHPGGNGPDVLVVDIPPSELAPHFQYGWEQKDKDRVTFNAPYRINDDTFYMSEHQVARSYQDRFARQGAADARLKAVLAEATDVVLSDSEDFHAWLVIAAQLTRPVPHLVPASTRSEAQAVFQQAIETAHRIKDQFDGKTILAHAMSNDLRVGLRRWTESNFLIPDRRADKDSRGAMVEFHHDGTVVVCVDLSTRLASGDDVAVNTQVLSNAVGEAVCLADAHRLHRAADTAIEITATVSARPGRRLVPFGSGYERPAPVRDARHPKRLLPASANLFPAADDDSLRACAHELNCGLLHQFGINVRP